VAVDDDHAGFCPAYKAAMTIAVPAPRVAPTIPSALETLVEGLENRPSDPARVDGAPAQVPVRQARVKG
jgi:hypothetical protein